MRTSEKILFAMSILRLLGGLLGAFIAFAFLLWMWLETGIAAIGIIAGFVLFAMLLIFSMGVTGFCFMLKGD